MQLTGLQDNASKSGRAEIASVFWEVLVHIAITLTDCEGSEERHKPRMSGKNTAQECVGSILEHSVSVELLWASTGAAVRASQGAQPLCSPTKQSKPALFEREDSKELPDMWTPPHTGSQTGGKHWKEAISGGCIPWWIRSCLCLQCATAVPAQPLGVPLYDHGGGQTADHPLLLSTDRAFTGSSAMSGVKNVQKWKRKMRGKETKRVVLQNYIFKVLMGQILLSGTGV